MSAGKAVGGFFGGILQGWREATTEREQRAEERREAENQAIREVYASFPPQARLAVATLWQGHEQPHDLGALRVSLVQAIPELPPDFSLRVGCSLTAIPCISLAIDRCCAALCGRRRMKVPLRFAPLALKSVSR